MKQRVDLRDSRFQDRVPILSSGQILRALGVGVLALGIFSAWSQIEAMRTRSRLVALEEEQARGAEALLQLSKTHPPGVADPDLEAEVEKRIEEQEAKGRLLGLLDGQSLGNSDGFSPFLEALARQRIEGLWLRQIQLSDGGRKVALVGSALHPELVPRLLQQLGEEEAFVGRDFRSLQMERSEEEPRRIDFTLTSHAEETS